MSEVHRANSGEHHTRRTQDSKSRTSLLPPPSPYAGAPRHSSSRPHRRNPTGGRVGEKSNLGPTQARGPTFKFVVRGRLVHCTRIDNFVGVQRLIPNNGCAKNAVLNWIQCNTCKSVQIVSQKPNPIPNPESEIDSQMSAEFREEPNEEANVFDARFAICRPAFRAILPTLD